MSNTVSAKLIALPMLNPDAPPSIRVGSGVRAGIIDDVSRLALDIRHEKDKSKLWQLRLRFTALCNLLA